ncbi:MAG TPA: glycosyl transferase [Cyanobacteria bacterium UBA11372]|nr:glycosyl transferase [Cyanobacteria bacterium UBA11372]
MITSDNPRVSIGLPIYNAEKFIRQALDALLGQTFGDFELIISDNGSTDGTEAICREYASKDSRIKYYKNATNLGAAKNFNRVFELSRGEYFKWASHDDICEPKYLERCVELLDRNPAVVLCYPKANTIDEQGNWQKVYTENLKILAEKPHERFYQLLETFGWYHGTQIYGLTRASELKKTMLLGNYPHADRVLLSELAILGQFDEVPEFLFNRRVHPKVAQIENPTYRALAVWFDPKNKGKIMLPRWRRYWEFCHGVQRHELSADEKIRCYMAIVRRLFLSPGLTRRLTGMLQDGVQAGVRLVLKQIQQSTKIDSKRAVNATEVGTDDGKMGAKTVTR